MDPYRILEVPRNFTLDQLKSQFKKLVLKYHPDRTNISNTPMFQVLADCYKQLLDEWKLRQDQRPHHELKADATSYIKSQAPKQHVNMMSGGGGEGGRGERKFNAEQFNRMFEQTRVSDYTDQGYEKWMKDPRSFNTNTKYNRAMVKYVEPEPVSCAKSLGLHMCYELGKNKVDDFSGDNMTSKNLNFMDFRVAHSTNAIIDERLVDSRKDYRTVTELEADRANVSHTMSPQDMQRYHLRQQLLEKQEAERRRIQALKDAKTDAHYNTVHKLFLDKFQR